MNSGMLWFDNDNRIDFSTKISRAIDYYSKKYGSSPNIIFVHPSMLAANSAPKGSIEIRSNNSILPNHFWVGQTDNVPAP